MPENDLSAAEPVGTLVLDYNGKFEKYSMTEIPADGSSLVAEATRNTVDDLDLVTVITNLRRASDLMFVAYVGTAGTAVRADISDCQTDLLKLCNRCSVTMGEFQTRSGDVPDAPIRCFQYPLAGNETRAFAYLKRCSNSARAMAAASGELAAQFRTLYDKTQVSHNKTLGAVAVQNAEKLQLERTRNELRARLKEQEKTRDDLAESIEDLKKLSEELKAEAETESKRQFTLAIVSSITGAIGQGLGGYANAMRATSPAGLAGTAASARTAQ